MRRGRPPSRQCASPLLGAAAGCFCTPSLAPYNLDRSLDAREGSSRPAAHGSERKVGSPAAGGSAARRTTGERVAMAFGGVYRLAPPRKLASAGSPLCERGSGHLHARPANAKRLGLSEPRSRTSQSMIPQLPSLPPPPPPAGCNRGPSEAHLVAGARRRAG